MVYQKLTESIKLELFNLFFEITQKTHNKNYKKSVNLEIHIFCH